MKNLIILDRDGVINKESPAYIKHVDEWHPLPGSLAAIAHLKQAGYLIAIATNQSGIGQGLYDLATLEEIHNKLQNILKNDYGVSIDYIAYCPHIAQDNCNCRKPKPGLLFQIAKNFNCHLQDVPFVGDSFRDLEAARHAGCVGVLVKTGNGKKTLEMHPDLNVLCFDDLASFAKGYY